MALTDTNWEQAQLADLSKMWTKFVTENHDITCATFRYEWWTDLSVVWETIDRLNDMIVGLPYPLHQEITEGWRISLGPSMVGWMISVNLHMHHYSGLFYGPRAGSPLHDIFQGKIFRLDAGGGFTSNNYGHPNLEPSQEGLEALGVVRQW